MHLILFDPLMLFQFDLEDFEILVFTMWLDVRWFILW